MNKKLAAKIFIIISIVFLISLVGIYGYRLIHFYQLEHPKGQKEVEPLFSKMILKDTIVTENDGLYQEEKMYYYKGNITNNYVLYSGILWRIVRVNEDESVTLISEDPITSMVFGYETSTLKDSYVDTWLNETFYPQLKNNEQYLVDTTYCSNAIKDSKDVNCKQTEKRKVALMSVYEYLKAAGSKGYLKNEKSFWTSTPSTEFKIWLVNKEGLVTDESLSQDSYYSYGVRPMITIKGDIKVVTGTGSQTEPYTFEENSGTTLKDQTIGKYVSYSDQIWKIIGLDDLGVKLALNGYLKEEEEITKPFSDSSNLYSIKDKKNIGYYLNSTYYESLQHKEYLVEYPWKLFYYNSENKYQYKVKEIETVQTEVGLLQVTDLFLNDFSDYALMTPTGEETIYKVREDGRLYADMTTSELKIRPAVVLKRNLNVVSGSGTLADPFQLGV